MYTTITAATHVAAGNTSMIQMMVAEADRIARTTGVDIAVPLKAAGEVLVEEFGGYASEQATARLFARLAGCWMRGEYTELPA